jgi:hypothetical protein
MTASQRPDAGNPSRQGQCPVPASPGKRWELQCPVPASVAETQWEDWRIALQPIPALVGWYRKHKVSGTLLVTAFIIVKGYVIARGDITTALGIVQYAGVASWAVAAVLSSLPTLAAAMFAITCFQILWPLIGRRLANLRELVPVVLVACFICAALTPWPVWLIAAGLGMLFGGLQWLIYWCRRIPYIPMFLRFVQLVILVGEVTAAVVILYTAWLPNENVTIKPHTVVVANVLAEDVGGRITLLDSNERKIIRPLYKDAEVGEECSFPPHGFFSRIYDAPTPWAWATTHWLHSFAPVSHPPCIKIHSRPAHPIKHPIKHPTQWLPIGIIGAAVVVVLAAALWWDTDRKAKSISISRPCGRRPWVKLARPISGLQR